MGRVSQIGMLVKGGGVMYYGSDPVENFNMWLERQKEFIQVAAKNGFTTEQAIELLKVWSMSDPRQL